MKDKNLTAAWVAVALLVLIALPTAYVVGYYARSSYFRFNEETPPLVRRYYTSYWEVRIFRPAAKVESALTGLTVQCEYGPTFQ